MNNVDDTTNVVVDSDDDDDVDNNVIISMDENVTNTSSIVDTNNKSNNNSNNNSIEDDDEKERRQLEREKEIERLLVQQEEEIDFNNNNTLIEEEQEQQQIVEQTPNNQPIIVETIDEHDNVVIIGNNEFDNNNAIVVNNDDNDNVVALRAENNNNNNNNNNIANNNNTLVTIILQKIYQLLQFRFKINTKRIFNYRSMSLLLILVLTYYSFRTRRQYYLTILYLCNSKWSLVLFGNSIIVISLHIFDLFIYCFLTSSTTTTGDTTTTTTTTNNGLRIQEIENLNDYFKWNITETCLALTMFRNELSIYTFIEFIILITLKCLHYIASLREQHNRLTQESITSSTSTSTTNATTTTTGTSTNATSTTTSVSSIYIRKSHIQVLLFLIVLQLIDVIFIYNSVLSIRTYGPSVALLFAFEGAIMLILSWSHILLWYLHLIDSLLLHGHEHYTTIEEEYHLLVQQEQEQQQELQQQQEQDMDTIPDGQESVTPVSASTSTSTTLPRQINKPKHTYFNSTCHKLIYKWKEYKPMFHFAIQLQCQGIQFIFYMSFFIAVLTFYGIPINLFREVYISFITFKERLVAFLKYRQLMANMNQFDNVTSDSELDTDDDTGSNNCRTCIICRDEMSCKDCKKLPICNHIFHKACLREWLVQQQTCPTCRSDITANTILLRNRRKLAAVTEARANLTTTTTSATDATASAAEINATTNDQQLTDTATAATAAVNDTSSPTVDLQQQPVSTSTVTPLSNTVDDNNNKVAARDVQTVGGTINNSLLTPPNESMSFKPSFFQQQQSIKEHDEKEDPSYLSFQQSLPYEKANELQQCIKESLLLLQSLRSSTSNKNSIVQNTDDDGTSDSVIAKKIRSITNTYPAIYKVSSIGGATVYNTRTILNIDSSTTSTTTDDNDITVYRRIPHGTIIVGLGRIVQSSSGTSSSTDNNNNDNGLVYIKIPDDGCVMESLVSRVATIRRS